MRHIIFAWIGSLIILAGCASTPIPSVTTTSMTMTATGSAAISPPTISSLSAVDWANTTYPDVCHLTNQGSVAVTNGQAVGANGVSMRVSDPLFAFLTRTDQEDAIIPYECYGATGSGVHILVFTGTVSQPVLAGQLPIDTPPYTLTSVYSEGVDQHHLELFGVGYSSLTIPLCCPDVLVSESYFWSGGKFVLGSHSATMLGKQLLP
jgi:hypothetical protein